MLILSLELFLPVPKQAKPAHVKWCRLQVTMGVISRQVLSQVLFHIRYKRGHVILFASVLLDNATSDFRHFIEMLNQQSQMHGRRIVRSEMG